MVFHDRAARLTLTARVWVHKLDKAKVFNGRGLYWWSTGAVFVFTFVTLWIDQSVSITENPIAYGTRFQAEFIDTLLAMVVALALSALVYHGGYAILVLTSWGTITCPNDLLERVVEDGNWAAALELAERFRTDPIQCNFWERKARELGYDA
ncbi:MAG: hypothetical protein ACFB11_22525 [Paracoccaceae bacterium]